MRTFRCGDPELAPWLDRSPDFDPELVGSVARTIQEVRERGEAAVLDHARRYDAPGIESLFVTEAELQGVTLEADLAQAIRAAIERVRDFHHVELDTLTEGWTRLDEGWGWRSFSNDDRESGMVGQRLLPMASAGIYVPGGKANYPSSVVMNVVPALAAGVQRIVVATPAGKDGSVSPAVLFACRELGVTTVIKAGGASAVAALALGLENLERVDIVAGPGNKYVNEAKRQFWGTVGLDSYAGPSEVCVLVDDAANAEFAAADLIAQVEHASDNVAMLVALSQEKLHEVLAQLTRQLEAAPRAETIRRALDQHGAAVLCDSVEGAVSTVNRFAPEHLALHVHEPESLLPLIKNAGAVMMGAWTPQSVADYCEGPSHTLPTSGAARFASPLSVATFLKTQTVSMLEPDDAKDLAPVAEALAAAEGLPAHAADARLRTERSP